MACRLGSRCNTIMTTAAATGHCAVIEARRLPRHGSMAIAAHRISLKVVVWFTGRLCSIVTARTAGCRATVIEVRLRPSVTAVTISAGVATRQMLYRFGARGDRTTGHMAAFAELGSMLEHTFDVAGFALALLMRTGQ